MKEQENIVLFDMDGTLTKPRQKIKSDMIRAVCELSNFAKIGIVTGSDYDYVVDQCLELWFDIGTVSPRNIMLMPCNGTKVYKWDDNNRNFSLVHDRDMRGDIGIKAYIDLLNTIVSYQLIITAQNELPYSGTFFQYRGSMLNWCPIGRIASKEEREAWKLVDEKDGIREYYLNCLTKRFDKESIPLAASLGGSTSIDIYPIGWDKTYSLKHLDNQKAWFIGDSCSLGGNDWDIYTELNKHNRAYATTCPEKTIEIIKDIIKQLKTVSSSAKNR